MELELCKRLIEVMFKNCASEHECDYILTQVTYNIFKEENAPYETYKKQEELTHFASDLCKLRKEQIKGV